MSKRAEALEISSGNREKTRNRKGKLETH